LLNDTLIADAIENSGLYLDNKNGILKDLDTGLYKLTIKNFFNYISTSSIPVESNISKNIFVDNADTGIIRYYSDIVTLMKFAGKYHELLPKYIKYLNNNVLNKYYNKIQAIKSLPAWDYESFHRRDKEVDLKGKSNGLNAHDYNIV
jgi:hypothetical protein